MSVLEAPVASVLKKLWRVFRIVRDRKCSVTVRVVERSVEFRFAKFLCIMPFIRDLDLDFDL